jgi:hypothetical protein
MNPDQEQQGPQPTPPPEQPTPMPTPAPAPEAPSAPSVEPDPFSSPVTNPAPTEPVGTTPNPFAAPTAPIGSSPVAADATSTPAPTGGSKKKLIILLSAIIGGLLILGGIAVALYLVFFSVGKQDYQAAYDQLNVVRDSIDESAISTGSTTEDTIESATAAFEEYKTEHAKLASLKAIQFDGEVNEKYKAYAVKADAFIAFTEQLLPSMTAFLEAADALKGFALSSTSIQRAIDAFEVASGKVTDPTLKAYVDQTLALYKKMLPQVKIYEDTSNSTSERIAAANEISDIASDAGSDANDMADELKDRYDEVDPEDAFDALGDLVAEKLNNS